MIKRVRSEGEPSSETGCGFFAVCAKRQNLKTKSEKSESREKHTQAAPFQIFWQRRPFTLLEPYRHGTLSPSMTLLGSGRAMMFASEVAVKLASDRRRSV